MPEGTTSSAAPRDPQALSEAVREAMYARDHAAQALGIAVPEVGPSYAVCTMTVRQDMVNGHDILHGGLCFTLADTAFAYACNSHDVVTVAANCSVTFCAPAKRGDVLRAEARETWKAGRSGITDVVVTNQDGTVIAQFRGNSRSLKGSVTEVMTHG
ncbi:hydroxyphenylacetyl-CoA thioesterase PaaI [Caenispirillum bisanense]|uniref:Acyl-CoA thioesterase n=1 Tax=Caenispirillum bisanense TaxID=414052 RepID=A0A286G1U7_9PROT|nr:hydroxyphenylacetyl-CoA thioesterase PaaI [Caenispirillum bisanense]SOD89149.1 acyl-CoA thioesterase [Caenispirillum bisanense]